MSNSIVSVVSNLNNITVVGKNNSVVIVPCGTNVSVTASATSAIQSPFTAGEDIAAFDVVVAFGNQVFKADASNPTHATQVVGIATTSANLGQSVEVVTHGRITNPLWSFDDTLPLFLATTAGLIVQDDVEAPIAAFSIQLGNSRDVDTVDLNIAQPILL